MGRVGPRGDGNESAQYRLVAWSGFVIILYFTLFPFDLVFRGGPTVPEVLSSFAFEVDDAYVLTDGLLNVLLFVPFSFGLTGGLTKRGLSNLLALGAAVLVGVLVSVSVEVAQGYTLARFPSIVDVLTNGVGCALGALVAVCAGGRVLAVGVRALQRMRYVLSARHLVVIYSAFFTVFMIASISISSTSRLSGWDDGYPLVVGNERDGERPWHGTMRSFYLLPEALSDDDVGRLLVQGLAAFADDSYVARHEFTDDAVGVPALEWRGDGSPEVDVDGVQLGDGWLQSSESVAEISGALASSSAFTLGFEIAADDLRQSGPARLVSISDGPFTRNLTLAQDQHNLVLRLRTRLTGPDGSNPEFVIPNVFVDTGMHHIVVRYDGTVRVDIDGVDATNATELVPEATTLLFAFPNDIERMRLQEVSIWIIRVAYRVGIFLPLAASLAWWRGGQPSPRLLSIRVLGAVVVPVVVFELVLSRQVGVYELRAGRVVLDVAMVAFSWWVVERLGDSVMSGSAVSHEQPVT